jgi:5-deoxy-D-glucuronate isomerase
MSKEAIRVSLRGKVVIMTGGNGFSRHGSRQVPFVEGAHVVSVYRNEDKQKELEPRNP